MTLPAGEHILRMTVTGSWFDIDYFSFVKGKDAKEPGDTSTAIVGTRLHMANAVKTFGVYDVNGMLVGKFEAMGAADVARLTKNVARRGGVYLVKSLRGGKTYRISVTK